MNVKNTNKWHINSLLETEIRNYVRNLIHEAMEAGFSAQELKNALTGDLQGVKDRSTYMEKVGHFLKDGYYYCVKMLGEPISKGSARAVFQIDDTRVLKLAYNMRGVAQNKAEVMVYQQAPDKKYMPIVYNDSDLENYFYVISEYVLPAEEEDFKKVVGIPFYRLESLISNKKLESAMKSYEDMPKVHDLLQYLITMSNMGVEIFDWTTISNWGLAKRNGKAAIVTLDNGFTRDVVNHFYDYLNSDFTSSDVSDTFGNMMGIDDEYRQNKQRELEKEQQELENKQRELEKKFSKILPKDTIAKDVVDWAISNRDKYYQEIIEEFVESNFEYYSVTYELIVDYIHEKYPNFDWEGDIDLPQYAEDSVAEYIKKMYSNVNDNFKTK